MTDKTDAAKAARVQEGWDAYKRGDSADTLRYTRSNGDNTENTFNIDRLVGYLDACAKVKVK